MLSISFSSLSRAYKTCAGRFRGVKSRCTLFPKFRNDVYIFSKIVILLLFHSLLWGEGGGFQKKYALYHPENDEKKWTTPYESNISFLLVASAFGGYSFGYICANVKWGGKVETIPNSLSAKPFNKKRNFYTKKKCNGFKTI